MRQDGTEDAEQLASEAGEGVPLEQYRLMFERNPHPMWVYDLDTLGFIAVNDAAIAHYGYAREEFLAMTIMDIRPADEQVALLENIARYERGERGLEAAGTWHHLKKDGTIIEVEITSHELPFGGQRGKVVLAHDVTARRSAEAAQRAQLAVARGLAESVTVEEALPRLLEALGTTPVAWDVGVFWMLDDSASLLAFRAFWRRFHPEESGHDELEHALRSMTFARGVGLPGQVWDSGELTYTVPGAERDSSARAKAFARASVRGVLAVPILSGSETLGVLELLTHARRTVEATALQTLTIASAQIGQFLTRKQAEQQLSHQALHDPLTGLPNRTLLLDRLNLALAHSQRRRTSIAVLFLDLDHFKVINDSLGHHAGDEVLTTLATRIPEMLRPGDTVARFGGDEFVIISDELGDDHDAVAVAERIASIFSRPFVLEGEDQFISASIGIAVARGKTHTAADLIRDADAAMYRAKERGRGRYQVFDEALHARTLERLRTENELRKALRRGELNVYYQPIVALDTRAIVGVEALIRWAHPQRGIVLPSDFIPVAEESGLILPIGKWVLNEACRQAAHWQRTRPDAPPIEVSVNVSPLQFNRADLPSLVEDIVNSTGVHRGSLKLEITESVLMDDTGDTSETMNTLRAQGVRLVLDDFGTGYSALGYLARFPIDALKIDRSFIAGINRKTDQYGIVQAVIEMAKALGLDVVAEGVETETQADLLHDLGCKYAQGFYFARPAPAEHISRLLSHDPSPLPPRS
jgi:diguanylate cyclase (GGDEF)-like protein/PAS domain S-box-containing protein